MGRLMGSLRGLGGTLRRGLAGLRGAQIDGALSIEAGVCLQHPAAMRLGGGVRLARNVTLRANTSRRPGLTLGRDVQVLEHTLIAANEGQVSIGDRSWFGPFCLVYGNGGVSIGSNVLVAAHSAINTVSHGYSRCDVPINDQEIITAPVVIEDDVWIGLNVVILQGVRIGRGSIIGAGAVVTGDIPPWSIALGTPARVLRRRPGAPEVT